MTQRPYTEAEYEGWPIVGASAALANAGTALSYSLIADPQLWELGDTVLLLVRADVIDVSHPTVTGAEDRRLRKHHLRATDVTVVPRELHAGAVDAVNAQLDRNARASEERQGTQRLAGL